MNFWWKYIFLSSIFFIAVANPVPIFNSKSIPINDSSNVNLQQGHCDVNLGNCRTPLKEFEKIAHRLQSSYIPLSPNGYMKNIEYVGLGFNPIVSNPHSYDGMDPAWRSPVLAHSYDNAATTSDGSAYVPDGINIRFSSSTTIDSKASTISSETELRSVLQTDMSHSTSIGVDGGGWGVSVSAGVDFSGSASFQKSAGVLSSRRTVFVNTISRKIEYVASVKNMDSLRPSKQLVDAFNSLPHPSVCHKAGCYEYELFFHTFGTHFASKVTMGGKAISSYTLSRSDLEKIVETNTSQDKSFGGHASAGVSGFGARLSFSASTDEAALNSITNSLRKMSSEENIYSKELFFGGDPPQNWAEDDDYDDVNDVTDKSTNMREWALSVRNNPVPISYEISSIMALLMSKVFPHGNDEDLFKMKYNELNNAMMRVCLSHEGAQCTSPGVHQVNYNAHDEDIVRYGDMATLTPNSHPNYAGSAADKSLIFFNEISEHSHIFIDATVNDYDSMFSYKIPTYDIPGTRFLLMRTGKVEACHNFCLHAFINVVCDGVTLIERIPTFYDRRLFLCVVVKFQNQETILKQTPADFKADSLLFRWGIGPNPLTNHGSYYYQWIDFDLEQRVNQSDLTFHDYNLLFERRGLTTFYTRLNIDISDQVKRTRSWLVSDMRFAFRIMPTSTSLISAPVHYGDIISVVFKEGPMYITERGTASVCRACKTNEHSYIITNVEHPNGYPVQWNHKNVVISDINAQNSIYMYGYTSPMPLVLKNSYSTDAYFDEISDDTLIYLDVTEITYDEIFDDKFYKVKVPGIRFLRIRDKGESDRINECQRFCLKAFLPDGICDGISLMKSTSKIQNNMNLCMAVKVLGKKEMRSYKSSIYNYQARKPMQHIRWGIGPNPLTNTGHYFYQWIGSSPKDQANDELHFRNFNLFLDSYGLRTFYTRNERNITQEICNTRSWLVEPPLPLRLGDFHDQYRLTILKKPEPFIPMVTRQPTVGIKIKSSEVSRSGFTKIVLSIDFSEDVIMKHSTSEDQRSHLITRDAFDVRLDGGPRIIDIYMLPKKPYSSYEMAIETENEPKDGQRLLWHVYKDTIVNSASIPVASNGFKVIYRTKLVTTLHQLRLRRISGGVGDENSIYQMVFLLTFNEAVVNLEGDLPREIDFVVSGNPLSRISITVNHVHGVKRSILDVGAHDVIFNVQYSSRVPTVIHVDIKEKRLRRIGFSAPFVDTSQSGSIFINPDENMELRYCYYNQDFRDAFFDSMVCMNHFDDPSLLIRAPAGTYCAITPESNNLSLVQVGFACIPKNPHRSSGISWLPPPSSISIGKLKLNMLCPPTWIVDPKNTGKCCPTSPSVLMWGDVTDVANDGIVRVCKDEVRCSIYHSNNNCADVLNSWCPDNMIISESRAWHCEQFSEDGTTVVDTCAFSIDHIDFRNIDVRFCEDQNSVVLDAFKKLAHFSTFSKHRRSISTPYVVRSYVATLSKCARDCTIDIECLSISFSKNSSECTLMNINVRTCSNCFISTNSDNDTDSVIYELLPGAGSVVFDYFNITLGIRLLNIALSNENSIQTNISFSDMGATTVSCAKECMESRYCNGYYFRYIDSKSSIGHCYHVSGNSLFSSTLWTNVTSNQRSMHESGFKLVDYGVLRNSFRPGRLGEITGHDFIWSAEDVPWSGGKTNLASCANRCFMEGAACASMAFQPLADLRGNGMLLNPYTVGTCFASGRYVGACDSCGLQHHLNKWYFERSDLDFENILTRAELKPVNNPVAGYQSGLPLKVLEKNDWFSCVDACLTSTVLCVSINYQLEVNITKEAYCSTSIKGDSTCLSIPVFSSSGICSLFDTRVGDTSCHVTGGCLLRRLPSDNDNDYPSSISVQFEWEASHVRESDYDYSPGTVKFDCHAQFDWPDTSANNTVVLPCAEHEIGQRSRLCGDTGWEVEVGSCQSRKECPIDCEVKWSEWSECIISHDYDYDMDGNIGIHYRNATIIREAECGGAVCPRDSVKECFLLPSMENMWIKGNDVFTLIESSGESAISENSASLVLDGDNSTWWHVYLHNDVYIAFDAGTIYHFQQLRLLNAGLCGYNYTIQISSDPSMGKWESLGTFTYFYSEKGNNEVIYFESTPSRYWRIYISRTPYECSVLLIGIHVKGFISNEKRE